MNRVKFTILAIMVAVTAFLFLLPNQPDAAWLKWLSIALWIVLIIIIARNSDLFERVKPEDVIDPTLLAFLKHHEIDKEFWINYQNGTEWRKRLKCPDYAKTIDESFNWSSTPQGYTYWEEWNHYFESCYD